MLSIKANVATLAFTIISKKVKVSREEVIAILFENQYFHSLPVSPFNLSTDGRIVSEIVDNTIDDLINVGAIFEDAGLLQISKLKTPHSESNICLPSLHAFKTTVPVTTARNEAIKIGTKTLKINLGASIPTRQFAAITPVTPEVGILFSLPPEHPVFKNAIPFLARIDNNVKQAVVLAPNERVELKFGSISKNYRKIKSIAYQVLEAHFDESRLENALEILFFTILPLSSVSVEFICENNHTQTKNYDNYVKALPRSNSRCDECLGKINEFHFIVKNPKIFEDWRNGVLSEWFLSSVLKKAGLPNTLWNFKIDEGQYDSLAFDGKRLIVGECKRIVDTGSNYDAGIVQLSEHKKRVKSWGLVEKTLLFTFLKEAPTKPSSVDVLLTTKDFFDFVNNPNAFL